MPSESAGSRCLVGRRGVAKYRTHEEANEDMGEPDDFEPGVIRVFDVFVVDVMPRVCGLVYEDLEDYEDLEESIVEVRDGGLRTKLLNLEGLLLSKRICRPKDLEDRRRIEMALARNSRSQR